MQNMGIRKNKTSITKKISLLILCIVVVAIGSYAFYAVWVFRDDKLKYVHLVNSRFTASIGKKIQSTLEKVQTDTNTMVTVMASKSMDDDRAQILKTLFQGNQSFISFGIYTYGVKPGGSTPEWYQLYGITNKDYTQVNDITDEQLQTRGLRTVGEFLGQKDVMKMHINNPQEPWSIIVNALDPQKKSIAMFFVSRAFMLEAVNESEVAEVSVVNAKGDVLVDSEERVGINVSDSPIFQLATQSTASDEGGKEFSYNENGVERNYIGNFFRINKELFLVSQTDKAQAFAGMDTILWNTIFFAINISGIAILIGLLISRTMTAPLRQLMSVTEDIGAGNYKFSIDINTNDEVGQLADYFTMLGKKLDEREAELEKATELAIRDGMTGAFNHRHFRNRIQEFFSLAKRGGRPLSLILTDIDFFKKFNDTYGHQQGDVVIKDIAKILQANSRETDFVARYGGEEFVVVLPDTDKRGAILCAEKMRLAYQNHKIQNLADGSFISSTCSLGVATLVGNNFNEPDDMIKHADDNLYKAKKGGRNQTVAD